MDVIARYGREDIALLNVGRFDDGSLVEFVESVQPPIPREEKWVLIVSTLKGCPIKCAMCDAGGHYAGKLTATEILEQIDVLVTARYPDRFVPVPKFKVQFARMGEPTLNPAVLDVLRELPGRYKAPGLMACVSSVLPRGCQTFLNELAELKNEVYPRGRFQMQFSLHSTDPEKRRELIDYPILNLEKAAHLGESFYRDDDRKIALNFALAKGFPADPEVLLKHFDPAVFVIKLTPLNPTERSARRGLQTRIDPCNGAGANQIVQELEQAGYEVILSLGEPEEDKIGSNCGQYVNRYLSRRERQLA
jgi:23S rRNA (adenine2503-C2)-methyltransferase